MADFDEERMKRLEATLADLTARLTKLDAAQEKAWTENREKIVQELQERIDKLTEQLKGTPHEEKEESDPLSHYLFGD